MKKVLSYITVFSFGLALGYFLVIKDNVSFNKQAKVAENYLSSHEDLEISKQNFMHAAKGMLGESIFVNGVVKEAYKNMNNEVVLYVKGNNIPIEINCTLSNSDVQIKDPIRLGEAVNLHGIFTQLNDQMYLKGCRLVYREPVKR